MQAAVIYVWTHDSIGLGEDGPTHQPVEHLAALRAIPGLSIVRPADANETSWAWRTALERGDGPVGIVLTRQNLPTYERGAAAFAGAEGVARGGYVLAEADGGAPAVILIGTGSEVQLAVEARERLQADGIATRVVSMPCREWFDEQDAQYRASDAGRIVALEHFGASADYKRLFQEFGITTDAVVQAAHDSIASASAPIA
jgi:transketolase